MIDFQTFSSNCEEDYDPYEINEFGQKVLKSMSLKITEFRHTSIISHKFENGKFVYFDGEKWIPSTEDDDENKNILRYWINLCFSPVPKDSNLKYIHAMKLQNDKLVLFLNDNSDSPIVENLAEASFNDPKYINLMLSGFHVEKE